MVMVKIILFVIGGFALGHFFVKDKICEANQKALNIWLLGLLFVMGISITVDNTVISNLKSLGFNALVIATCSVVGSVIALLLINPVFKNVFISENEDSQTEQTNNTFLIFILVALVLGALGGLVFPVNVTSFFEGLVMYLLYLLLFSVGYDLYCNRHLLALVKKLGWKILLIPMGVMLGSILFAIPLFIFLPYNIGEIGAVVSGFGWYSLSSIIIGNTYSSTLGVVALLSNVFREVLAFIITPLLPKILPPLTGVAPAGATAMDTLLPLISKSSGPEYTVPALVSGVIISSCVYLLVPLFIEIAKVL